VADNDDDNVIPFGRRFEATIEPEAGAVADALLEECVGEYEDVIVVGFNDDGEITISGTLTHVADIYDALSTAAQKLALAHLDTVFSGQPH
jgi:hypothetical protein